MIVFSILLLLSAFVLVVWRSRQAFLPNRALSKERWTDGFDASVYRSTSFVPKAIMGETSVLIWQSFRQNRWILLITFVCLNMVSPVCSLYTTPNESFFIPLLSVMGLILSVFMVGWMGVFAFHSDQTQSRIRFLAERGISLRKIWWTRHALPGCVILVTATLMIIRLRYWEYQTIRIPIDDAYPIPYVALKEMTYSRIGLFLGIIAMISIFCVSGWIGQVFRNVALAIILSPIATGVLFFYSAYLFSEFRIHAFWFLTIPMIAMIATAWNFRDWTDGCRGIRFYGRHAVLMIAGIAVPLIPLAWDYLQVVRLESSVTYRSNQILKSSEGAKPKVFEGKLLSDREVSRVWTGLSELRLNLEQLEAKTGYRIQFAEVTRKDSAGNSVESTELVAVPGPASMKEEGGLEESSEQLTEYRQIVSQWNQYVAVLRAVPSWHHQQLVDEEERTLWMFLQSPKTRQRIGEPLYREILGDLADSELRRTRHLLAICHSWKEWTRSGHQEKKSLIATPFNRLRVRDAIHNRRHMVDFCSQMIEFFESGGKNMEPQGISGLQIQVYLKSCEWESQAKQLFSEVKS